MHQKLASRLADPALYEDVADVHDGGGFIGWTPARDEWFERMEVV